MDNQLIPKQLTNTSVVIIPTDENIKQAEQFGKSALEAIIMGIPVITSRTGNYIQLDKEINTLQTIHISSELQIKEAIEKLEMNYPSTDELGKSRAKVLAEYSHEFVSKQWDRVFSDV